MAKQPISASQFPFFFNSVILPRVTSALFNDASKNALFEQYKLEQHPREEKFGDYTLNLAMRAAPQLKQPPMQVAEAIATMLNQQAELKDWVDQIKVEKPGFINFYLKPALFENEVALIAKKKQKYGSDNVGNTDIALIEYSQMNVAKPMHVGHLRTLFLGDSLKRIYKFLGFDAISDTHYGDWGTQFGMVLYAYKHWGNEEAVKKDPVGELVRLYQEMDKKVEADPELREAAKAEFKKLEDGDKENLKLWKWFVKDTVKVFEHMYKLLDTKKFDYNFGESHYEEMMKEDLKLLLDSGVATKEGELVYVDLEPYKLGRCIFQKSDGASTYHLRDLSTYRLRVEKLKTKRNLYVVDSRQAHHFRQLFKVIELLKWPNLEGTKHVSYGFVTLPEGSLSTRKGRIVQAIDVVEQGMKRAEEIIAQKNPDLKDKSSVAQDVARAAIKFANLLASRESDIVFEWDKVLSFEGDTGPYLQYTYARIKSVLRKAKATKIPAIKNGQWNDHELALLRYLYRFQEEILSSYKENDAHFLAEYLIELAHRFNSFYGSTMIANEEDKQRRANRLALSAATAQVLKNGLELLGINTVEEM